MNTIYNIWFVPTYILKYGFKIKRCAGIVQQIVRKNAVMDRIGLVVRHSNFWKFCRTKFLSNAGTTPFFR